MTRAGCCSIGLLVSLAALGCVHAQQVGDTYDKGSQVRIGQYSTQSALPDSSVSDPLAVFVQLTYPRQGVATVGDAVRYTLLRTGWALAPDQPEQAQAFMRLPLPESQRTVGTFRVRDVLQALVGPTWTWQEDPVQRRLWLKLSSYQAKRQQDAQQVDAAGATVGTTAALDASDLPSQPGDQQ